MTTNPLIYNGFTYNFKALLWSGCGWLPFNFPPPLYPSLTILPAPHGAVTIRPLASIFLNLKRNRRELR
jgi:hypothetical protein